MLDRHDSIERIGNVPIVRLNRKFNVHPGVEIYMVLMGLNPSGSHKDIAAKYAIENAIKAGKLKPGMTIVEASSGNMASAVLWIARQYGVKCKFVLATTISEGKKAYLRALGAELVLTDGNTIQCSDKAKEIAESDPDKYFFMDQFNNQDCLIAHYELTGNLIISQVPGVTHFFTSLGSGASLVGISKRLKEYNSNIKCYIVAATQDTEVAGMRPLQKEWWVPPMARDFLWFERQKIKWDKELFADLFLISRPKATKRAKEILDLQGEVVGVQTGANLQAALQVAKTLDQGKIVILSCDTGWKNMGEVLG